MPVNQLIIHEGTQKILGVKGGAPDIGSTVELLSLSDGGPVSAYWVVTDVPGGQTITLKNNPRLCLDLHAESLEAVTNGTHLLLSNTDSPAFERSNLWSWAPAASAIISLCGAFKVLDSGDPDEQVEVWQPALNSHQAWAITSIEEADVDIDRSKLR